MIRKSCVLFLCGLSLAACSADSTGKEEVKKTVIRYNRLLADGYRTFNMTPLKEVTTVEQGEKAYHHMAALGELKVRMDSTLKKIEFLQFDSPAQDKAIVTTREVWDFIHHNIKTGKKQFEQKDFIYDMKYELQNFGGHWVITNITAKNDVSSDSHKNSAPPSQSPSKTNVDKW